MTEKIIFRGMLSEIKELADKKGNCLTLEEVNEFFSNAHLNEEQISMICEYLAGQKIEVQGYEPKGGGEAADRGSRMDASLTEDACMEMYLADLRGIFRVPDAEEEKLFLLAAAGDGTAKEKLAELYLNMVCEISHTYAYSGLPASDLIQEGNIALLLALGRLEVMDNLQAYREFLYQEVSQAMEEALAEQQDWKDMDEKIAERVNHLGEAVQNLSRDLGRKVSVEELSAYLEMPMEEIKNILKMAGNGIEVSG